MFIKKLNYKKVTGDLYYSEDDKIFFGRILGSRKYVYFQGTTIYKAEKSFKKIAEEYLKELDEKVKNIKNRK